MRKSRVLLALMSVLIVSVIVLAACMPVAAPTAAPAAQPEAKKVKVALVLDGKIDDNGWNQAGYEGLTKAKEQYGLETAYSESVPIPDYEKAMRDYANQGFDVIIAHSSIAKDAVMNTAKDFPKLAFIWTDGDTTESNVAVIRPMSQEASYLAGILAGKMTQSNTIGMVGGIDIPSTHRSYGAFKLGVESVNPGAKILVNWIGSFLDVSAGHEAALSQIESGADVIFGNGDGQNIGVLKAASEKNVLAIGAVRDQFTVAPNVVLTSVNWGFDSGIGAVIKDVIDGKFAGKAYEVGLAQGADLMPYHDNASKIPDDVKALIEQKRKDILSGALKVPDVPMGQ
jgi:basic membrane protein A and related proteins